MALRPTLSSGLLFSGSGFRIGNKRESFSGRGKIFYLPSHRFSANREGFEIVKDFLFLLRVLQHEPQ